MRATPADRPGDQQQDEEQTEREDSEAPGRNRQFAGHLGLEKRQSQGHTPQRSGSEQLVGDSVAACPLPSFGCSTVGYCRIWPDPVTTYFVEVISGRPIGPRACSF